METQLSSYAGGNRRGPGLLSSIFLSGTRGGKGEGGLSPAAEGSGREWGGGGEGVLVSWGSRRAESLALSLRPRVLTWRLVPGVGSEWAQCKPAQPEPLRCTLVTGGLLAFQQTSRVYK